MTPDETQIIAITTTGIYWFDANTLEELDFRAVYFGTDIKILKISPTTEFFVFIDSDGIVSCQMIADDTPSYTLEKMDAEDFWFSPNGSDLYISYEKTRVWNLKTQEWREEEYPTAYHISFSGDGSIILMNYWNKTFMYDENGTLTRFPELNQYYGRITELSGDGRYIALAFPEGQAFVKIWDISQEKWIFSQCFDKDGCYEPDGSQMTPGRFASPIACGGVPNELMDMKFPPMERIWLFSFKVISIMITSFTESILRVNFHQPVNKSIKLAKWRSSMKVDGFCYGKMKLPFVLLIRMAPSPGQLTLSASNRG